jgi:flagellar biosynthesis chaperone FliJ
MDRLSFLVLVCAFVATGSVSAQAPSANARYQEQLAALIKQVRDQQTELTANQAKIDEKLTILTESIRQARIYSSRAGR